MNTAKIVDVQVEKINALCAKKRAIGLKNVQMATDYQFQTGAALNAGKEGITQDCAGREGTGQDLVVHLQDIIEEITIVEGAPPRAKDIEDQDPEVVQVISGRLTFIWMHVGV